MEFPSVEFPAIMKFVFLQKNNLCVYDVYIVGKVPVILNYEEVTCQLPVCRVQDSYTVCLRDLEQSQHKLLIMFKA